MSDNRHIVPPFDAPIFRHYEGEEPEHITNVYQVLGVEVSYEYDPRWLVIDDGGNAWIIRLMTASQDKGPWYKVVKQLDGQYSNNDDTNNLLNKFLIGEV